MNRRSDTASWPILRRAAPVLAGITILAACNTTPPTPEQQAARAAAAAREDCLFSSTISDWAEIDRERLLLFAPGPNRPYLVELSFPSNDLPFNIAIGVRDGDGNGRICSHGFDAIVLPGHIPDWISIRSVQRLTPEEGKKLLEEAQAKRKARRQPAAPTPPAGGPAQPPAATPGGVPEVRR
jgi:Family of unknown function (DUF6491)